MARPRSSAPSPSTPASSPAPATTPAAPQEKSASSFMLFIWGIPIAVLILSVVVRRSCMG